MVLGKPDNKMAPFKKTKKENLDMVVEKPEYKCQDCGGDNEDRESVFQSLGEFMLFLMGNEGLKHIADKIFGALESRYVFFGKEYNNYIICMVSLANLRLVSRAFRDYLDNHMSMLHLQIKHFRNFEAQTTEDCMAWITNAPFDDWIEYGLFDYMENEVKDVSKLRTFLGLLRDMASDSCHLLIESPFKCMVNNHMHKELELLMDSPLPIHAEDGWGQWVDDVDDWPSYIFFYACAIGCGECVQPFLDHIGDKFIDVNWTMIRGRADCMHAAFENDFEKGKSGARFRPRVLPLLLRNKDEKGIDVNALNWEGYTVKERVTQKYKWEMEHYEDGSRNCVYAFGRDEHEVYKMLGINPDDYPIEQDEKGYYRYIPPVKSPDPKSDSNSSSDSSFIPYQSDFYSDSDFNPKSDSNSSSYSSSTSDSESNWETVSDTDPDA